MGQANNLNYLDILADKYFNMFYEQTAGTAICYSAYMILVTTFCVTAFVQLCKSGTVAKVDSLAKIELAKFRLKQELKNKDDAPFQVLETERAIFTEQQVPTSHVVLN